MKLKRCILYFGLALWLIAFFQMIKTGNLTETEEEAIVTAFADNDFLNTVSNKDEIFEIIKEIENNT